MSGASLIGLEAFLVIGAVLAFGVWELLSLRRDRRRDASRDEQADTEAAQSRH